MNDKYLDRSYIIYDHTFLKSFIQIKKYECHSPTHTVIGLASFSQNELHATKYSKHFDKSEDSSDKTCQCGGLH